MAFKLCQRARRVQTIRSGLTSPQKKQQRVSVSSTGPLLTLYRVWNLSVRFTRVLLRYIVFKKCSARASSMAHLPKTQGTVKFISIATANAAESRKKRAAAVKIQQGSDVLRVHVHARPQWLRVEVGFSGLGTSEPELSYSGVGIFGSHPRS